MKKRILLLLWIAAIIFPLNYVEKNYPTLGRAMHTYIAPEWVHIVGHTTLFAGVVLLTSWVFQLELSIVNTLFLACLVIALGSLQELFQLIVKNRPPGWPEFFDLGVDGIGGLIGWTLYFSIQHYVIERKTKAHQPDHMLRSW